MTVYQAKTLENDCSLKIPVRQMLACLTIDYAPLQSNKDKIDFVVRTGLGMYSRICLFSCNNSLIMVNLNPAEAAQLT